MIFDKSTGPPEEFDFKHLQDFDQFVFDQAMLNEWLEIARGWLAPVVYVVCVLGAYIFRMLQALIYACIGLAFASMRRTTLPYPALMRLSVMSVTPGIIIETVLDTVGIIIPYGFLLYFLIAMGFLAFGVGACAEQNTPTTPPTGIPQAPAPPASPYTRQEM